MKKVSTLAAAVMSVSFALAGAASAENLVKNGSFESDTLGTAHEFGASHDGQTLTSWTSANPNAFNVYFPLGTATGPNADTRFGENGQYLWTLPGNSDPDGGAFVALDGDTNYNGALTQVLTGLTVGQSYTVSFDWAAAQYRDRTGQTTEQLVVGFGNSSWATNIVTNPSQSATPWVMASHTFTADGASQVLSFLSVGTPAGLPPVALLDGVSVSAAPEPTTWLLMLLGVGGLGLALRRRSAQSILA